MAGKKLIEAALDRIRAYHGSPYKFDKFDLSKVGTGEGAQAFGHGAYLAEAEPVAMGYRDRLAFEKPSSGSTLADAFSLSPEQYAMMDERDLAAHLEDIINNSSKTIFDAGKNKYLFPDRSILTDEGGLMRPALKEPGYMYEVDVHAHPEKFLDWLYPLSNQSDFVQKSLRELGFGERWTDSGRRGQGIYKSLTDRADNKETLGVTSAANAADAADASKQLLETGIQGIRYPDQFSRNLSEGTSNYVVFDPSMIEILRRYADGGVVEREHHSGGELVGKALRAVMGSRAKRYVADPLERDINLGKFLQGTKTVNDEGDLFKLYHITSGDFSEFIPGGSNPRRSGPATWLSANPDFLPASHSVGYPGEYVEGTNVMPLWARMRNPLVVETGFSDQSYGSGFPFAISPEGREKLISEGYDSVINRARPRGEEEYIVLHPNQQLKSATGNTGMFDPSVPRIDENRGGEVEREHHSGGELVGKALRAVMGSRANPVDAADRIAFLLRSGRAKEVTSDLANAADQDILMRHYFSGGTGAEMPMAQAERLGRAKEMGYHTEKPYYHAGDERRAFDNKLGELYVTVDKPFAEAYQADKNYSNLMSLLSRHKKTIEGDDVIDFFHNKVSRMDPSGVNLQYGWQALNPEHLAAAGGDPRDAARLFAALKKEGFDSAFFPEDFPPVSAYAEPSSSRAIFYPETLRDVSARFDPRLSHVSGLDYADGGAVERQHHADGERVTSDVKFDPRELAVPLQFRALPQDSGFSVSGDGKQRLGELVTASLVPTINAGPISGGPILVGAKDYDQPIVGYQASAALPEGFSASYSSSRPLDVPSKYSSDTLSLAKEILGMQVAAQLQKKGDRSGYGVSLSKGDDKGQSYLSVSRPSSGGIAVMGGKAFRFADGGEVYQSTGEKLIGDENKINWGDPNEARDFFRADAEMMRRIKEEEAAKNTTTVMPSGVTAYAPTGGDMRGVDPVLAAIRMAESSNNVNAQNPKSSAGGLYGFIDRTWVNTLRRMDPERYGRMSDAELVALKKGPQSTAIQQAAADYHLRTDVAPTLTKANIPLTPGNIYLGWFQGPQGAVKANTLPPDARVADVFPKSVEPNARIKFNGKPYADWTIADLRAWADATMAKRMGRAEGGEVVKREHHAGGKRVVETILDKIRAWHGSPYKFEQFDVSKIGTGEGQARYGKGIYLAEDKGLAQQFMGNPDDRYRRLAGHMDPKEEIAFDLANRPGARDMDILSALAQKYGDNISFDEASALASDAMKRRGYLYEVDIKPEMSRFLNWNLKLSEQPEYVRELITPKNLGLREAGPFPGGERFGWVDDTGLPMGSTSTLRAPEDPFAGQSGGHIYKLIGRDDQSRATDTLRDLGIPGITYRDPSSFGKMNPTQNFVIFNPERDLEIVDRYAHGGEVDQALHIVREHHAEGQAVGTTSQKDMEAQRALDLANSIRAYERSIREIEAQPEEYRMMTHRPQRPRAPIEVEGGFIGKRQLGTAPYDIARTLSGVAQGAYDLKTLPLYAAGSVFPPAAAAGTAIDVAEGVAAGSPTQVAMGAFGTPGKVVKNVIAPLSLATGALSPDEAQAAKAPKISAPNIVPAARAVTPSVNMSVDDALAILRKTMSEPKTGADPRFWHGISSVKLSRPIDEMKADYVRTDPVFNVPVKTPSDYEGTAFITALGDPSIGGVKLVGINGEPFTNPTVMQAGPAFTYGAAARGPDKAIWASDLSPVSGIANRGRAAYEAGFEPFLNYVKMGAQSPDYSHHVTDPILDILRRSKVSKASVAEFDRKMREGFTKDFPAFSDWPGLSSKNLEGYLFGEGPGKSRTAMAKLMDTAEFKKAGMPDVGAVRFAATDPDLLNVPGYTSGRMIARMDPTATAIREPAVPHKTYATQLSAHPEGADPARFMYDVPFGITHKDFVDKILAEKPKQKPSQLQYTFTRSVPTIFWTPENVDRVSRFMDLKQKGLIP